MMLLIFSLAQIDKEIIFFRIRNKKMIPGPGKYEIEPYTNNADLICFRIVINNLE